MTVRDVDKGAKRAVRAVKRGAPGVISVGIHSDGGSEAHGKTTVAFIGEVHEFGLGVPQRSWLIGWFEENAAKLPEVLRLQIEGAIKRGEPLENAMKRCALLFQASIQKRFQSGIGPALAESTIRRKGSSKQLIDTGLLRSSVTGVYEP